MRMKDFERWFRLKASLDADTRRVWFHEREIWWCALGANIGFEQDGHGASFSRPVLIVAKCNLETCIAVPLTTRRKTGRFYAPLGSISGRASIAILSQVRLIDARRLRKKIATVPMPIFRAVRKSLIDACFEPDRRI
jgi:mRNA interferase MazF